MKNVRSRSLRATVYYSVIRIKLAITCPRKPKETKWKCSIISGWAKYKIVFSKMKTIGSISLSIFINDRMRNIICFCLIYRKKGCDTHHIFEPTNFSNHKQWNGKLQSSTLSFFLLRWLKMLEIAKEVTKIKTSF